MALEHWSLPTYSLCYYGIVPPGGHRHKAKWDLLLQQVREAGQDRKSLREKSILKTFITTN